MDKRQTGHAGEAAAAAFLRKKGYRILDTNYRCRFGEVDIIASGEGCIAFVEVKTRRGAGFAEARESVKGKKQKRIRVTAELWLSANETPLQPRFDVIEIYYEQVSGIAREINHIENAF